MWEVMAQVMMMLLADLVNCQWRWHQCLEHQVPLQLHLLHQTSRMCLELALAPCSTIGTLSHTFHSFMHSSTNHLSCNWYHGVCACLLVGGSNFVTCVAVTLQYRPWSLPPTLHTTRSSSDGHWHTDLQFHKYSTMD